MNGYHTRKTLQRPTRAEYDRELAERASRADAIIAAVSIFALIVLAIVQIAEKVAI